MAGSAAPLAASWRNRRRDKFVIFNPILLCNAKDCTSYVQGRPIVERRRVETRFDLVGERNGLKLPAGNHAFDVLEALGGALLREVHHDRGAGIPIPDRYRIHDWTALLIIDLQGTFGLRRGCKRECEDPCVHDRLTSGLRSDWTHRMRCVSEQRHATKAPARKRLTVVHGKFIDFLRLADQIGEVDPTKVPVLELMKKSILGSFPVPRVAPCWGG